ENYYKGQPEQGEKDSTEQDDDDTRETGVKSGVGSSSHYDDSSGQVYEVQTKPSVESETEYEMEPQSESSAETQEPEATPESEPPKERVQPPSEKNEPSSEVDSTPSEPERPRAKDETEEPDVESTPTQETPTKRRSVEDTGIQEEVSPRTEQTTLKVPQETEKSEKEKESDEAKEEDETEVSEIEVEPRVAVQNTETETSDLEKQVADSETKIAVESQEIETETSDVERQDTETEEELETDTQEPEQVVEPEDLAWQEALMRAFNELPEEWREEVFREYLRGLIEDEDDLKRLLRKHGLEYLPEDEEQMEEAKKFLELQAALREQGEDNLEDIAAELSIDIDQAEKWSSREEEPQILKDVLNLEGMWVFWEMLRLNAENHRFPESPEELEDILQNNPMLALEDPTLPFEFWKKDAKAWIEMMQKKKRGEIRYRLRNGREIYHREDIERLATEYGILKAEIIAWLRGEKAPPLIRRIGEKKLKKQTITDSSKSLEMGPILYSPKGSSYSVEDIWRLYYIDGLSKSEIARSLGIANSTVHRVFEKNKWRSLPTPKKGDPKEAFRLSQLGLTHKEIAKELGVTRTTVGSYLREFGVKRKFLTDLERKQKHKEKSKEVVETANALRNKLFGTKCIICGATREKRGLAIHRKDCIEHDVNALWRPSFLQKVKPEEWAALCVMCHRGVHWAHEDLGLNWQDIENLFRNKITKGDTQTAPSSKQRLEKLPKSARAEIEKLRKELFGDRCYFCGLIPKGKNKVIHRKDGSPHKRQALWRREFLLQINPDEWVMVCQKHHRYVHWGMKHIGLNWNDISSLFKKNKENKI
ncbi:MAG: sigma factor-like helix-turn-helix DNA-binding protein, partial [Candidatus Thorarchaeota archaeon]